MRPFIGIRRCSLAFTLAIASVSSLSQPQTSLPPDLRQKIDKAAQDVLAHTGVPSASVAIVKDGAMAYVQAYGAARLDPNVPARPAMRYSIGSISKQFTAAAILLLQEDGTLSLDDKVAKYVPNLTPTRSASANCCRTPPATRTTGPRITFLPS